MYLAKIKDYKKTKQFMASKMDAKKVTKLIDYSRSYHELA